ncbi:MAG: hypothetical protein ABSB34_09940 [Candidatus Limnocylindrales bacterium]
MTRAQAGVQPLSDSHHVEPVFGAVKLDLEVRDARPSPVRVKSLERDLHKVQFVGRRFL